MFYMTDDLLITCSLTTAHEHSSINDLLLYALPTRHRTTGRYARTMTWTSHSGTPPHGAARTATITPITSVLRAVQVRAVRRYNPTAPAGWRTASRT